MISSPRMSAATPEEATRNMRQAQVVTHGVDGALAERLRELAQTKGFRLRETSQLSACANLLDSSSPSVLVVVLGRDLERELALLELAHASMPRTATIVIGEADHPVLAGLAWELGATFVLFPPMPVEWLGDLLENMLRTELT
jgi:DNA-binding NtrC family response regulator